MTAQSLMLILLSFALLRWLIHVFEIADFGANSVYILAGALTFFATMGILKSAEILTDFMARNRVGRKQDRSD